MNQATSNPKSTKWRWFRTLLSGLISLAILGGGVGAVILIFLTEPVAEKKNTARKSAALVDTIVVQRGTFRPKISVLGTVQSARQITLSPRVNGQVLEQSTNFFPGGMVKQGELLVRIDPADFENALSITESELLQIKASMEIEQARQRLAEKELKLLAGSVDDSNRGLVLREPQIASIRAQVAAAEAAVERAQLDLERTQVYAPFDAHVLSRSIDVGSQVRVGDDLGQLVGLDEYWVIAAVPVRNLRWLQFVEETNTATAPPSAKSKSSSPLITAAKSSSKNSESQSGAADTSIQTRGSKVILRNRESWGADVERVAYVSKLIGTVDLQSRLAQVLITVSDPLSRHSDLPPLIINTLIETEIEGRALENVVRLNREYLRGQDTVWVMVDEKLEIRRPQIEFRDAQYAYITEGLEAGEEIVTTTLATVADGIGLKRKNSQTDSEQ